MQSLPSYKEIKIHLPLSSPQSHFIAESRKTVRNILNGRDPRLLLIVGPCSIHDRISAREYAVKLCELAQAVSSEFFLVMRVYFEKPRTTSGWNGFLFDPLLDGSYVTSLGIKWARQLLLELATLQVPAATEFLDPMTSFYYDDLITWGSIGARTACSQIHRQLASALPMPIGFKNGIAGNISAAVNGALAASFSQTYIRVSDTGDPIVSKTPGNPDTHIVLRGGESGPNYDPSSISEALILLQHAKLNSRLLIDCAHHNSEKKYDKQLNVFQSVIHQIVEGNTNIRGLMLESHLHKGNQSLTGDLSKLQYGVSITDECLDWKTTEHLILSGASRFRQEFSDLQRVSTNC